MGTFSWIGPAVQLLIALGTIAVLMGTVKSTVANLVLGQEKIYQALHDLASVVSSLTTSAAVNTSQHDDMSRRIVGIERNLGEQGEQIRVLRTRSHLHASKIMELDPKWNPYHREE